MNAEQHLVVLDRRAFDVAQFERVGRAVPNVDDRFHRCPLFASLQRKHNVRCKLSSDGEPHNARTPLSRERVLRAGVALADRGGIEALSMRKLAQETGRGDVALQPSRRQQG